VGTEHAPRGRLIRRGVRALAESGPYHRLEVARHERHYARSMDRPADFAAPDLPRGYGIGLTERAVEFGWVGHQLGPGDVLDAGTCLTLEPEARSWPERGVRYLYEDLRRLEIPDATFDLAVSLSTLEHVGLDNSRFYDSDAPQGNPDEEAQRAMRELRRVVKPGGHLLITVPFGRSWRTDWVRTFDGDQLDALVGSVDPVATQESVFRRASTGWRRVHRDQAADAGYRRFWSEAVACVRIQLPS
jgi:SAM-dependent methyltransferase